MGCCSSCLGGGDDGAPSAAETEMQAQNAEADKKILSIARGMSAPSIEVADRTKVRRLNIYCTRIDLCGGN